jgi:hypothetical protein
VTKLLRTAFCALAALCAAGALAEPPAPAPAAPPAAIPKPTQRLLEKAVQAYTEKLVKVASADERPSRRGTHSRSFRPVGDGTYRVTYHRDTIDGDALRTERLLLTLKPAPKGDGFEVTGEQVEDTWAGLHRGRVGDEQFFAFDSFTFEREGLRLKAGKGSAYRDYLNGALSSITVAAEAIESAYEPPADWAHYRKVHEIVRRIDENDIVYTPTVVRFSCDALSCQEILDGAFGNAAPIERSAAGETLTRFIDEAKREREQRLREDAFFGFRPLPEPGHRYWVASARRSTGDHWVWLAYDNWDPLEMSFGVGGRGTLFAYPCEATRKAGVSPWDLDHRDDAESRDYQIEGLTGTVELALSDPEDTSGDITYRLKIKRDLDKLWVAIARLRPQTEAKDLKSPTLVINSLQDGEGRELTWAKTGPMSGLVLLGRTVPAGSDLTLRIQFDARRSIYNYNWSFSYLARGGWLPLVRFGDMIEEFDLTVKVPDKYTTLGICRAVESRVEDGVSITRYRAQAPIEFPTVIFGVYETAESAVQANRLDGTKIPVRIFVDKNGMIDWGIRPKQLQPIADQAAEALNFFRDVYQVDYPYSKLDLVNDPFGAFYGQAPSSIVYLGSGVFRGEGMLGSAGGSGLTTFVKTVVPHEVAHQWWGSLVANANMRNYWFIETLAEFSSALFVEARQGRKAYDAHVAEWRRAVLETDLMSSVQDATTVWSGDGYGGYVTAIYNKGPYAFHVLRMTFGDEKMKLFLREMAKQLAGKEVTGRELQQVAEQVYGGRMDWFFDQWIRGLGLPEYSIEWKQRATEDGKWLIEGKVHQRVVVGLKKHEVEGALFRGKVMLTVAFGGGRESKVPLLVEGQVTPFKLKMPEEAKSVVLNRDQEMLALDVLQGPPAK